MVLERLGYRVLLAQDGEEAVKLYEAHRGAIDLLLLDVVMPRLGGWEGWERMKESGCEAPLILMTGYSPQTVQSRYVEQNRLIEESGVALLQKPYNIDGLGRKVREVLDQMRLTQKCNNIFDSLCNIVAYMIQYIYANQ